MLFMRMLIVNIVFAAIGQPFLVGMEVATYLQAKPVLGLLDQYLRLRGFLFPSRLLQFYQCPVATGSHSSSANPQPLG